MSFYYRFRWLLLLLICAFGFLLIRNNEVSDRDVVSYKPMMPPQVAKGSTKQDESKHIDVISTPASVPMNIAHDTLLNREDFVAKRSTPSIIEVLRDRPRFVSRAENGDAGAAMALFFADNSYEIKRGDPHLSPRRKESAESVRWLELAANAGDLEAMVQYALLADSRMPSAQERARTTPEEQAQIAKNALSYLIIATTYGYRDAFYLLADAYEVGRFGDKDIIKSYAYRLALNNLGPDDNSSRLVSLKAPLLNNFNMQSAIKEAATIQERTLTTLGRS